MSEKESNLEGIIKGFKDYVDIIENDETINHKDNIYGKLVLNMVKPIHQYMVLALLDVQIEFTKLREEIKLLKYNQKQLYYFACDRCGKTILESYDINPIEVCTHPSEHHKGICGGKFTQRLSREEYIDYFNHPKNG